MLFYILGLVILAVFFIKQQYNDDLGFATFIGFIPLMAWACWPLVVLGHIADARGVIEAQAPIVIEYERYAADIDSQLSGIKGQNPLTFNKDTPVRALVEARMSAQEKLLGSRKAVAEAELEIAKIRHGIWGWLLKSEEQPNG